MVQRNIRTDKWRIVATPEQKELLQSTVSEFRYLVRSLVGVIYTHWSTIGKLEANEQIPAVERLIHATTKNPEIKYRYFGSRFHKFPSYYRRGAIQFAVGQVSSFVTRYREWQSGIRKRKDALPPRLNAECGTYPPLYKNQCIRFADDNNSAAIKVFTGTDWIWITVGVTGHRQRHLNPDNKRKSPYLIVNSKSCHLSVPFQIKKPKLADKESVLAVDLGINTTATVSIVNFDGTVSHREFIHPGRECDSFSAKLEENPYKLRLLENIQMITNPSMKVKILPSKLKSDSLSVHAEYARNHTERSWKQGVTRPQLQGTLTLMGSSQGKTEPKKATHWEEDAILSLTTSEKIPPKCSLANGMSKGFRQLKWLCLKEHNNRWIGTNRNEFGVYK